MVIVLDYKKCNKNSIYVYFGFIFSEESLIKEEFSPGPSESPDVEVSMAYNINTDFFSISN